jgi:hypothetical protein
VNVSQVTPSVTVTSATNETRFADQITVNGSVTVEESGAQGVPVAVYAGGTRIGETNTDVIGAFALTTRVPAEVPDGTQDIRAEVALSDSALASATATTSITVESTATSLSIDGQQRQGDQVQLSGTLTTVDGTPVEEQVVRVSVAGEFATTVRTAASGAFATTVEVPSNQVPRTNTTTVELTAQFDGEGTSLESVRSQTEVELVPPTGDGNGDGQSTSGLPVPLPWLGVAGVVVLVGLGMAYRTWGREGESGAEATAEEAADKSEEEDADQPAVEESDQDVSDRSAEVTLDTAREQLDAGRFDRAVQTAYGLARTAIAEGTDVSDEGTHWEFYTACEAANLDADVLETLEQLTEAYERATFAPSVTPREMAEQAISFADSTDLSADGRTEG